MTVLETQRLILRKLTPDDLSDLRTLYSDPDVMQFFPQGPTPDERARRTLEWSQEQYKNGTGLWAVIHKEHQRFIGRCGLIKWDIFGEKEIEIAYMIAKDYWGIGLGTEAASAILDYAFAHFDVPRLICIIHPENKASRRVAEKCGMIHKQDLIIRGLLCCIYAIERDNKNL